MYCLPLDITSVQMTQYKHTDLEEDNGSLGSVQLGEGISSTATHVRYHTGGGLWKSLSKLEKSLLVSIGTTVLLSILFLITIYASVSETRVVHIKPHNKSDVCLAPHCIKSAAHMLSSLDLTADPCEDFYQYSCGGWVAENPVPDGKSMWGTFSKLEQQNQVIIKHVLEKSYYSFKSNAEKKAKVYYESCLDVNEIIEELGAQPMLDLLEEVGGWNISGDFNLSCWSFQKTINKLHNEYNMGGLFSWAVGEDDKNSSRFIIQIDQGGLTLPTRENYLNKTANGKVLEAYLKFMTKVGVLLGGDESATQDQMKDVIEFETNLAKITQPEEKLRDETKLYNLMSLAEVQERAPFMSWREYFQSALQKINKSISSEEMLVVRAPEYLEKVSALVSYHLKTDKGKIIINNYLVWQTVRSMTGCLPKAFRDAHKGLRKALMGTDGGEEPWLSCVTDTNNVLGFAVGAMFVRHFSEANSKTMAEMMVKEIKNAFMENLRNLHWMDFRTRVFAIKKASAITDMIGFPDFILDPKKLDEKYKDLEIKKDEYFMNNIRVNKYNLKKNIERLGKIVNKARWDMSPSTVNAYYAPTKNQIVLPAGILRFPFFDVNRSASLNYGSMGVVMGHELTHAFDDLGREYDQYGNLHKWWLNETLEKFKEKTRCVVKQYSNYKINGWRINGKQTLGENIADNGGLRAAYYAYLKKSQSETELPLPGLNLTHKQLFFLSFAQVWCSSSTFEASILQIEKDTHSPSKYRVIGPLSNLPEFSKEFNCPLGSKMNPEEKCDFW